MVRRSLRRVAGGLVAVTIGLAVAQGMQPGAAGRLPPLDPTGFEPLIRKQVETAYRAARAAPGNAAASGQLGALLVAYQQFESASPFLERARALDPNEPRWSYFLGLARRELARHAQAAEAFEEVLRRNPDYLPARLKLADSLLASGDVARSESQFRASLEAEPTSAAAEYGLGRCKTALGDHAGAVAHYRRAAELHPDFGSAHYALALAYRDLGEPERAAESLQAYRRNPHGYPPRRDPLLDEADGLKTGAFNVVKRAAALEAAGHIEASIREHLRALELDPRYVQAHANLIQLYARAGVPEKVEEHYRAAARLNPNLAEIHYNFGVFLVGRNRTAEAAEAFRKVLAVNPHYAEARANLAYILMTEGKLDEAERHYRAALADRPNFRLANFNLGRILVHVGKLAEAIERFEKILEPDDADTPNYLYALGAAYARSGDRERALRHIRAARERAAALGQKELLGSIDRDLAALGVRSGTP